MEGTDVVSGAAWLNKYSHFMIVLVEKTLTIEDSTYTKLS